MSGVCAREGCGRHARGDAFCSTYCAKRHHGTAPPTETLTRYERRKRNAAYEHGRTVAVENTDAMTRRVPGSSESNFR